MSPVRREALCSWLDATIEGAKDADIALAGVYIWVEPPEWDAVCDLFDVTPARRDAKVVHDIWQGVKVWCHRKPAEAVAP